MGPDGVTHVYQVLENGNVQLDDCSTKLSLSPVIVEVIRQSDGSTKLFVSNGRVTSTVNADKVDDDYQLFLNCLGWPDNLTYVRFDEVSLESTTEKA